VLLERYQPQLKAQLGLKLGLSLHQQLELYLELLQLVRLLRPSSQELLELQLHQRIELLQLYLVWVLLEQHPPQLKA
jgi:hypothetical protein